MTSPEKGFLFPTPNALHFPSGLVQNPSGSHERSIIHDPYVKFPLVIS